MAIMATKLTTVKRQSYTVFDKLRIIQFAEQQVAIVLPSVSLVFPRVMSDSGEKVKKTSRRCLN